MLIIFLMYNLVVIAKAILLLDIYYFLCMLISSVFTFRISLSSSYTQVKLIYTKTNNLLIN